MRGRVESVRSNAFVVASIVLCLVGLAFAQGDDDGNYVKKERELMARTVVKVVDGKSLRDARMMAEPLFRYGDEPQKIGDSTIWVWKDGGRPVAIQKIEVNKVLRPPGWTYCLSALSNQRIEVKWPNVRTPYRSQQGLVFREIPDAPAPGSKSRWAFQSRSLSRGFSASTWIEERKQELRLLPNPILKYEYKAKDYQVLAGAVYSVATGTNPSIYLLIELREVDGQKKWFYASSRATSWAYRLSHKGGLVRSEPGVRRQGHFPTWTFSWVSGS